MIIAVCNPKGGVGKTTVTVNLAGAFARRGWEVLVVDTDPQGSLRDWHAADPDNSMALVALDRPSSVRTVLGLARSYDYVLLDGAAKLEDMLVATVKVADFVLVPVQPSPYDVWGASDLVDLVRARQEVTDGRPAGAFVVNRRVGGTRLAEEVVSALAEYPLPTLAASITQRQVYAQTAAAGRTVFDGRVHLVARGEIDALADEVESTLLTR